MKNKPSLKKRLIMGGILILTLAAFFAGEIGLSSAHAARLGKPGQQGTITATVLELPHVQKHQSVTIMTTASTSCDPDTSVVASGNTIVVGGTVNQDGSITASTIGFSPHNWRGPITNIDGSTTTMQARETPFTLLVTSRST